jgi:hypothetical protein
MFLLFLECKEEGIPGPAEGQAFIPVQATGMELNPRHFPGDGKTSGSAEEHEPLTCDARFR